MIDFFQNHQAKMIFDEDEAPPLLVEVGEDKDEAAPTEPKPIKVPITIVTGRQVKRLKALRLLSVHRLPWGW